MDLRDFILILSIMFLCSNLSQAIGHSYNPKFDDQEYLHLSQIMSKGQFSHLVLLSTPYAYGYLFLSTISTAIELNIPLWIPATIEYIGLICLIYLISLRISGNRLVSYSIALITLSSGFIVGYSQRILPDMFSGLILALGIYIMLSWRRRDAFFAGIIIGTLLFIKLGSASIIIPILVGLLIFNKPALPFFIGTALMFLIFMISFGFNFSIFSSYSANQIALSATSLIGNITTIFIFFFPFPFITKAGIFSQIFSLGMLATLSLIGIYIAYLRKDSAYAIWSFILIASILYMMLGTESLTNYQPITIVSRYFELIAPLFAILASYGLNEIYEGMHKRYSNPIAQISIASITIISIILSLPMLVYFAGG